MLHLFYMLPWILVLACGGKWAFAECYYVSPDLAPTKTQAEARAVAYIKKLWGSSPPYTCEKGSYEGQANMWLCGSTPDSCDIIHDPKRKAREEAVDYLYQQGSRGQLRPAGEGDYELSTGETVECDRAFGCRRKR